jgi:hypothetical protein
MIGFLFLDLIHALPFELLHNKWFSRCVLRSNISTRHAWKLTLNMRDLNTVIRYETNQQFMLKFTPIYIVLVHVLRKNLPEPEPAHDGHVRFLHRSFWALFVVMKQIYDLC